ncbi:MAG: NHL repeat-containing protein [Candidatus Aminicenantes bacterium]|nr:MAG: NHL repeat-containing protein [Candidatus Aminicenantes bacterium]
MKLKKSSFLVSILAIVLQVHLPRLSGNGIQKIFLEEVLSIGSVEDDALFQWVGVISDSSGYIYVTDNMDYSLKKFDGKGNLIKKTGRKGQGPGEFLAPRYLGISSEFLYVTDQFKPKIQVFDKDLNYNRSISISMPVYDIKVLNDDEIAVAAISTAKAGRIFIINSKGKIKRELQYSDKKSHLLTDVMNFDLDSQGNLYLVYNYQDKVEKFDPEGRKIWSNKMLNIKNVKREKIGQFTLPTKFVYKDIALDSSGNLFILGGSFSKNPSCDVYVLSPEGKSLTTFTLPDSSHCIYIDGNDFLYSRANDGVTLKKFKIKHGPE